MNNDRVKPEKKKDMGWNQKNWEPKLKHGMFSSIRNVFKPLINNKISSSHSSNKFDKQFSTILLLDTFHVGPTKLYKLTLF